jgi:hypothetical protein
MTTIENALLLLILIFSTISFHQKAHAVEPHEVLISKKAVSYVSAKTIDVSAKEYSTHQLDNETYRLYPIPVRSLEDVNLAFLWGVSRATPGEGRHFLPPHWMVEFNTRNGALAVERSITPSDLEQTAEPGQFIGSRHWKEEEHLSNRRHDLENQFFKLLDKLIPYFSNNAVAQSTPMISRTTLEMKKTFILISKDFMRPYYCAIGYEFFNWIDAHAHSDTPPICPL